MDQLFKTLTITYECINCQRLIDHKPLIIEYIDEYNDMCFEYYCKNCSKYLFLTSSTLWTPFLTSSSSP